MTRWVKSSNWSRKGAKLPTNVKIAKAKGRKRYKPAGSAPAIIDVEKQPKPK